LLREFENSGKDVVYYALDLSLLELRRTFSEISAKSYKHVQFCGLHGTYQDAQAWLQNPSNRKRPTCVLSMGSSLGNFNRPEAAEFLAGFVVLLGPSDSMLIGLDGCKDKDKISKAYNDSMGVTIRFYLNGLSHANTVLGYDAFKAGEWEVITTYNGALGCHQSFYAPTKDITIDGIGLYKGERILFEEAFKYDSGEREQLWRNAGLTSVLTCGNHTDDYREFSSLNHQQDCISSVHFVPNWLFARFILSIHTSRRYDGCLQAAVNNFGYMD
jgi:L-histidine Nalpha-methyltransferase / hercynylcysteine S-oxide synthase